MANLKYNRVLIKMSGEVFKGKQDYGIDGEVVKEIAGEIKDLQDLGVEVGIVIGGGNIWRFRDFQHLALDRVTSDNMGMMATVMNALAFENLLKTVGVEVRAMSSFPAEKAMENYVPKRAKSHLSKGKVVVFAGGTGSPFFTTDSAAALRALEMECDVLMKATKVDYVYDKDPMKFDDAKKFEEMSYDYVIENKLGVMDLTCASLCREGGLPMLVFNLGTKDGMKNAILGKKIGTIIS